MPGSPGLAHPTPVDTTPISAFPVVVIGPPESACERPTRENNKNQNKYCHYRRRADEIGGREQIWSIFGPMSSSPAPSLQSHFPAPTLITHLWPVYSPNTSRCRRRACQHRFAFYEWCAAYFVDEMIPDTFRCSKFPLRQFAACQHVCLIPATEGERKWDEKIVWE